jgi:hypothetical protein
VASASAPTATAADKSLAFFNDNPPGEERGAALRDNERKIKG